MLVEKCPLSEDGYALALGASDDDALVPCWFMRRVANDDEWTDHLERLKYVLLLHGSSKQQTSKGTQVRQQRYNVP